MDAQLIAIAGPWKGTSFPLDRETNLVGREPDSHICLDDSVVSRRHCEIVCTGERCTVHDLGSYNHTYVNGKPVNDAEILPGDKIEIGGSVFIIAEAGDPAAVALQESVEMKPEDSVYFSSTESAPGPASSPRATGDLCALLRLSASLHSFRGLPNAHGQPAREGLG